MIQELSLYSRYGKVAAPGHLHARGLLLCRSVIGIPQGFGFDCFDASAIVEGCYKNLEAAQHNRLQLARLVVKECIGRISRSCFDGSGTAVNAKPACLGYSDGAKPPLPLSCKAAIILKKEGFVAAEIAEILNARLATVHESLARGN